MSRRARRDSSPLTWPVTHNIIPGVSVLTEPDGFKLCYCDTPPTAEQRQYIHRLIGPPCYVSPTGLSEAIVHMVLAEDEHRVNEQDVLRLRRIAGEAKWAEAMLAMKEFLADRARTLAVT